MRPKKVVLCVDADEDRLGRMRMVLETWGYHVDQCSDAVEALKLVEAAVGCGIDALIADAELLGAENLIARSRAVRPEMGTLLLDYSSRYGCVQTQASVYLPGALCTPAEIRERLKVLVSRKRGPRKFHIITEQPAEAVA